MIDQIMTYVVLPVGGFVLWMHQKQVTHYTKITVLEKLFEQTNLTHDREIKEIKDQVRDINAKLDRIEQTMRK